ncbi:MAG: hypothetical protein HeimC2_42180 [Candidatus Heimdallarchaeota archaeon LC_2]|nr:MAG: hypothetical protein HeimC2_42160 [Candidatus Heimdallarchaeota archaeon LC_2]OLS19211.1 MAG: hypothetical protein HeimC2_42180 [Candidatus Heimdallarchaeota archaeon LC_2]
MIKDSSVGRIAIIAAMVPEAINIANRSVNAESWIDRSWLLPLALINLWILIVVATYSNKFEPDSKQIISPNNLLTN